MDVSGSMDHPRTKLKAAVEATLAAIDCMPRRHALRRDRRHGACPAGLSDWRPAGGGVRGGPAGPRRIRRPAASRHGGGTAMGRWLIGAYNWFASTRRGCRHAVFLTDGREQDRVGDYFAAVLDCCRGPSNATVGGWGPTGRWPSCARSPPRCSAPSTSWPAPEDLRPDFQSVCQSLAWRGCGRCPRAASAAPWAPRSCSFCSRWRPRSWISPPAESPSTMHARVHYGSMGAGDT